MATADPVISVVIPSADRPQGAARAVASALASLGRLPIPAEVIVVDNGRTLHLDPTTAPFTDQRVRVVRHAPAGASRARNCGTDESTGDVLLFLDDDVEATTGWAHALSEPILSGRADAVAGQVRIAEDLIRPWMTDGHRLSFAETIATGLPFPSMVSASFALSRTWALRIRFDEALGPGALGLFDDLFLWHQLYFAGARLVAGSLDGVAIHHFDPARLCRDSLLDHARKAGRSEAYAAHHYFHADHRLPRLRLVRHRLAWAWSQAPWRRRPVEFATEDEMRLARNAAYFSQYLVERRTPRRYRRHGAPATDGGAERGSGARPAAAVRTGGAE